MELADYKTVRTVIEIENYLGDTEEVALDIETSPKDEWRNEPLAALDANKADITGISISVAEGTGIYIPLRHKVGKNADTKSVIALLKERILKNKRIWLICHNIAFETAFFYALGIIPTAKPYDTIAAAQLTLKSETEFRDLSDSGLKTLVPHLYGEELPKFEEVTGGKFFDELDPDDAETCRYACADSDYALRLYNSFNAWFQKYLPLHETLCREVESPAAVYSGLMRYNGVGVDVPLMELKRTEAESRIEDLRGRLAFIIGDVELGANAGTQAFKDYLFKDLKLPVLKSTAKWKEAADDETMILLSEYCKANRPELVELFALVQEFRKWAKIKSTYIDGYLAHLNNETGRVHPDFMPLATDTGRFACRKPNLQNLPQPNADPIGARNFIVARDGYKLIEADFSQVELRIAAYLSGDETMLNAYRNGEDIHAITTAALFQIPLAEAKDKHNRDYKKRRTVAKTTIFGVLYGIYEKSLRRNLKVDAGLEFTDAECKAYIANIKARYARLADWQREVVKAARAKGYVETKLGRRRYLKGINSPDFGVKSSRERMVLNTPVQGLAADCLKLAMGRLVTALADNPWIRPTMTVHDSLVFEVEEGRVAEAIALVKDCMEAAPPLDNFDITLIAEVAAGTRYGELEE
jgi:DNA polymerase-1